VFIKKIEKCNKHKKLNKGNFLSVKNIALLISICLLSFIFSCSSNIKIFGDKIASSDSLLTYYTNPFGEMTIIEYIIENQSEEKKSVTITIYNVKGELIRDFFNGFQLNGKHNFEWNKKDNKNILVDSGIYFCKIVINGKPLKRILLVN